MVDSTNDLTQSAAIEASQHAAPAADSTQQTPRNGLQERVQKRPQRVNPAHLYSELRRSPEQIRALFREGRYPYKTKLRRTIYEQHKEELQVELLKVQNWVKLTGQRIIVFFEGRDAAGKGGTIKRFMEHLNPRAARVVALEKPTEHELGQWYFQRYLEHLPTAGEIVFFDRSWYNRAGVERVMGFCEFRLRLQRIHATGAGILSVCLIRSRVFTAKQVLVFCHARAEQRRRFTAREAHPLKQWKLSHQWIKQSLDKWDDYTEAKEAMFFYTDTADAPWTVIKSDDKKRARLNCMQHFLSKLEYPDKDTQVVHGPDPLIVGTPSQVIEKDRHLWS